METGLHVNQIGGLGALLSQLGFHVVSDTIVHLHPDYLERLEPVTNKDTIHVLSLGPYDLAISKIARGLSRDIEDIVTSEIIETLKFTKLERLYLEASAYWIGNPEHFSLNWKLFKDACKKIKTNIRD